MEFEAAERQKLVSNEDDINDLTEVISHNTSSNTVTAVQKTQTPSSPVISSKNSFSKASERTSDRVIYQNERKYDFRSTKKKMQRDDTESNCSGNLLEIKPATVDENSANIESASRDTKSQSPSASHLNVNNSKFSGTSVKAESLNKTNSKSNLHSFATRPLKHHSFISETPDVRHMEKALLKLLEDFHHGKLKAFGSGNCMNQMKNIREQQERLAKLHFDLGSEQMSFSEEMSQEKQRLVIEQLEQLSVSIEKLNSSNTDV